jgi:hypothetical protein
MLTDILKELAAVLAKLQPFLTEAEGFADNLLPEIKAALASPAVQKVLAEVKGIEAGAIADLEAWVKDLGL